MLNKVMLIGNLGQDPELKYTQSGTAVCKFSIATTENYRNNAGERHQRTEWHNIVVWGKQGENVSKYIRKGSKVFVEGKIQSSSWEDKDGNKRFRVEINANGVTFLDSKSNGRGGSSEKQSSEQNKRAHSAPDNTDNHDPFEGQEAWDDDLPF